MLNHPRPLWKWDQGVVKTFGRDEPIVVATRKCMEAMLGISLYSYLPLTSKNIMTFLLSSVRVFSVQQNQRTRGPNKRFCPGAHGEGGWEVGGGGQNNVYICK
jgi:hypothetical protein